MKKIILSVAVLAMVLVGCKKEETKPSDSSSSSSTPKILKETEYSITNDTIISDSSITVYAYDSKGRLISQTGKFSKDTYEYNSANLITHISNYSNPNNNVLESSTYKYILDSKGLVIKYVSEAGFKDTLHISYSADGFMKAFKIGDKTEDLNVEIKGDNIIKREDITFEYYLDKTSTIRNVNRGINFFGKDSKNLVKSEKFTSTDSNGGTSISEYTYTYEFDSKNRVVKSTRTQVNSGNYVGSYKTITKYQYAN